MLVFPIILRIGRFRRICGTDLNPVRSLSRAESAAGNGVDALEGIERLLRSTNVTPCEVRNPSVPAEPPSSMGSNTLAGATGS